MRTPTEVKYGDVVQITDDESRTFLGRVTWQLIGSDCIEVEPIMGQRICKRVPLRNIDFIKEDA